MVKNRKSVEKFIAENASLLTVAEMSRRTHVSASTINRILRKKKIIKRKIYSKTCNGPLYNPNKPTETTYMLVCRYNYEGLSIPEIANTLNRKIEEIDRILSECIKMNVYWKYNYFGRSDEEKENIREKERAKKSKALA